MIYIANYGTFISTSAVNAINSFVALSTTPAGYHLAKDVSGNFVNTPDTGGGGGGTVTSVSVVSANGFAGTVATSTTTPAITVSTTVTGLLKGNGSAVSAATDGTDYLSSTTGLKLDQTSSQTISNGQPIWSTLTASQVVVTDASKKFSSLGYSTTATASNIVERDANANIFVNNYFANSASTVSAGGTTVLTVASARNQTLTGSANQTFQLPDATTLPLSSLFIFNNNSSGSLIITNAGTTTLYTVPSGGEVTVATSDISTANGAWDINPYAPGTVTWGSGTTGLVFNTALTTTPSISAGISAAATPSFIPQRGSSTTGFGGDSTNLYLSIGGASKFSVNSTGHITVEGVTSTGATGTGELVFGGTPTLNTPVFTGLPTGTGVASAATASTLVARDANANISFVNWTGAYTTTATAAGTTTLTVGSNYDQFFTGTSTQTVVLPVTSTLTLGHQFSIVNNSTGAVTVNSSGGNAVLVLAGGTSAYITCILTSGTTAASWSASYINNGTASGKKLSVSNSLTLAGTDNTTMTFPSTSATIARTDAAQTFTGAQSIAAIKGTLTADTDGATITFDKNTSDFHSVTLGGNRTLALSNMAAGDRIVLRLAQDATGSRTVTWFTTIKWAGGSAPTLTTTASKADMFGFLCTSAGNYDGFVIGQDI